MIHLKHSVITGGLSGIPGLLAGLFLLGRASAQPVPEPPQRWLLVFDTSIAMERWLPGTTTELQNLFFESMSGQLHPGDSVGVWTFDEELRTGKYPLFDWFPEKAADEASQLINFLDYEQYSGSTRFAVLRQALQHVIADSQRLTIVIFCDGKDDFKLTPYDDGINQTFRAMQKDRKKVKNPFVVVLRTQNGKFVGATVNLPPGSLNFPAFPPLALPPTVVPANLPAERISAVPPPVVSVPPLVIVGTNVLTNQDEIKKLSGP